MFFQDFDLLFLYFRSLKCPLHIVSYALRIGSRSCKGSEFLITHIHFNATDTFLLRVLNMFYTVMYALGPYSRKRSQIVIQELYTIVVHGPFQIVVVITELYQILYPNLIVTTWLTVSVSECKHPVLEIVPYPHLP